MPLALFITVLLKYKRHGSGLASFHDDVERFSMEPLDTDIEYLGRAPRPSSPAQRLSILYIFPILGVLLVLLFAGAVAFQWDLSLIVNNLVVLMVILFFVFTGIVFWALTPRASES
ncbi:MAG TPA: hypothetical protein VFV38_41500 [Ktedonobacteraceae bacterium]|nr:hypothetical protein [Ktedonobacteraceae bacterium]